MEVQAMDPLVDQEQQLLEMINKVQMFQIACNKVNKSLMKRHLQPVFDLEVSSRETETRVEVVEQQSEGTASVRDI